MASSAVKSVYLDWLSAALAKVRGASSTIAASHQDLVLGYATGYDAADVAIFVRSLRSHYSGPVAIVVDGDADLRAFLAEYDVEALDAPCTPDMASGKSWAPHPVVSRFAGFDLLLSERPWVRNALLTDVRDVVFQGDPFAPEVTGLEFFAECDAPLKSHDFNMKYLRAVAGDCFADSVADRACICVGTILGSREALSRFCRLILMLGAIPRSRIGGAFGTDQASCNLAVHLGLIDGQVFANHSRVATLGMVPAEKLSLVEGLICNPDGSVSPIVHQYDRHPELMTAMWARWASDMQRRERCRPRTLGGRLDRMRQSVMRRTVELR
ncbi:hypothetical protein GCM10009093_09690 [Brevundimonas terrae]|uniref:DUF4435 domain-containing protein n=1 Tax=Brevundimonas terrae TaxID=363631 RepID=A0ABN0Y6G1_9CAUL|nr:hypothetical protein [Brevundimonas terrae]NIJ25474.1 hypothetical protein [Brevundimonas terrae]